VREITVKEQKVTEYYHRAVVVHLIGFGLPIVLDIEPLLPGEGEITAARRLLVRLLKRHARSFDAVAGDALYFEAPLMALCRKHGKHLLAVVKDDNPALLQEVMALTKRPPDRERDEEGRTARYWDVEDLKTDAIEEPFRAVRVEETWTERHRVAGLWVEQPCQSHWVWGTTILPDLLPARQIRQVGHQRWRIENTIFNALSRDWALDHCFHHDPAAILNLQLILCLAHLFVACFRLRNLKDPRLRALPLITVATLILMGLTALAPRDVPWRPVRAPAHPAARAAPASP
jgi:hypothetical protein